jgi:hypothetical protein
MKNEPQCWTCEAFASTSLGKSCSRYGFLIPKLGSTLFICKDFRHYADPSIKLRFDFGERLQEQVLYSYHFMETQPPEMFSPFAELERSGEPE